jgi:hypothetical protein
VKPARPKLTKFFCYFLFTKSSPFLGETRRACICVKEESSRF